MCKLNVNFGIENKGYLYALNILRFNVYTPEFLLHSNRMNMFVNKFSFCFVPLKG